MGTDFSEMLFLSVFFLFDFNFNFIFNRGSMMLLILLRYLPASNNEMEINFVHAEIHLPLWFLVLLVGAFLDSLLLSVRGSMIYLWKNCVIFLNGKYWRSQLYITLWDPFSFILLSFLFSFAATDTKTTFTLGFTVTVSFLFLRNWVGIWCWSRAKLLPSAQPGDNSFVETICSCDSECFLYVLPPWFRFINCYCLLSQNQCCYFETVLSCLKFIC